MKILDIAFKDLLRSVRSAFAIGMMVVAPLVITGLMYFAFSGMSSGGSSSLPAVKVGVVNGDTLPADSPLEAPIGDSIRSMFFDESVKTWIVANDYADESSARAAVDRQEIGVAVIIPASFSADLLAGKKDSPVKMIQDPTLSVTPMIVRNMLTSLLDGVSGGGIAYQTISEQHQAAGLSMDPANIPVILAQYETWYADFQRDMFHHPERAALVTSTPATDSQQTNALAGMLGLVMMGQMIFFAFFTGANSMTTILHEQEEGTLARLFTTPTSRTVVLAGKFVAVVLTVILQGLVLMSVSRLVFGVNWGNPAAASLALIGQVIAATGLGVLLISFVKNSRQSGPVLGGALTGLGMLSGLFTVSIPNMPDIFNKMANFTPQGWVLKSWQVVMNGGLAGEVLLPFSVCVVLGAIMFAIGAIQFRRRFA